MTRLRNVAVVLAGGTGTRVGLSIPKQLIKIAGKPIIEHTIAAMQAVAGGRRDHGDDGAGLPGRGPGHRPRRAATPRSARSSRGPAPATTPRPRPWPRSGEDECNVLLHDAVRPLVSQTIIAANVDGAADLRGGGHRDPLGRHGDPGRRRARQHRRRAAPAPAAPRPDPAVLPAVDHPRRVREGGPGPELHRHRRLHGRAALPARGADRRRGRPRAQHEGDRADRRLHRRQAVPADLAPTSPRRCPTRTTGPSWRAGRWWSSAARTASAATSPTWPAATAPTVKTFSRSTTGTHVERAPTSPRPPTRCWPRPAGSTSW